MKRSVKKNSKACPPTGRDREKGAALVSVVLIAMLLLVVCGSVVLMTGMSRLTTVDAVSEAQAHEAATAGLQIVLNTLRGNNSSTTKVSFKDAAVRLTSNKLDDWMPEARMSNWLAYSYPTTQPDRVPLTASYNPQTGLAYSVTISAPDLPTPGFQPTPNPTWIDGPVVKPVPAVKPVKPAWHPWNSAHCSWDYTHCSLYNPPNNGTLRSDGTGCRHKHCIPPANLGEATGEDGYQRLLVRVVGYGPRGARKELEALVQRTSLRYSPEALMYIQGNSSGTAMQFNLTNSPEVQFDSVEDIAFGVTNSTDETAINAIIAQPDKVTINGKGDDYEVFGQSDKPVWLSSANDARAVVAALEADAKIRGRWFTSYPAMGNAGTDAAPQFTFVRGNAALTATGSGVLVVTGTLTLSSFNNYKGLILLLGGGRLDVSSGSSSTRVEGSVVLANFGATGDFGPPTMNVSGGKYVLNPIRPGLGRFSKH